MKTVHTFGSFKINSQVNFGTPGNNAWSALHGIVADAGAFVMQITGYYGGAGPLPPYTNYYLGPTGPVADIALATHFGGGATTPELGDVFLVNADGDYWAIDAEGTGFEVPAFTPSLGDLFLLNSNGDTWAVNGSGDEFLIQ